MAHRIVKKQITQKVAKKQQQEKYEQLVQVDRDIDEKAAEKAGANKEFNADLKDLRKARKTLLDVIDSGEETLDVDCYEVPDEARMEMTYRRVDNDVELPEFTRPFTAEERQLNFDDVTPDDPGDDAEEGSVVGEYEEDDINLPDDEVAQ
jgi:hypothetical protein